MYTLNVQGPNGPMCPLFQTHNHSAHDNATIMRDEHAKAHVRSTVHADNARLVKQPTYKNNRTNKPINGIELPFGQYNKVLAIYAYLDQLHLKATCLGYIVFRKRDNYKMLFVRHNGETILSPIKLLQRKKTKMQEIREVFHLTEDTEVILKSHTGRNGGKAIGGPKFKSSSVATFATC